MEVFWSETDKMPESDDPMVIVSNSFSESAAVKLKLWERVEISNNLSLTEPIVGATFSDTVI
ncbi:hypothetical protein MHK_006425 [Candidatus Magnetomorum sp. HK-1]|nr:hypothetical protein MHK_006425 [Candidatus Magnetomorum sp. HK-1]